MKEKIMKHLRHPFVANDLLGAAVVYVLIIWVTYSIVAAFGLSYHDHHAVIIVTHWIFGCMSGVIILCRLWMRSKKESRWIDIVLSLLMWVSFGILLCITLALIVPILGIFVFLYVCKKILQFFTFLYRRAQILPNTIVALAAKAVVMVLGLKVVPVEGSIPKGVWIFAYAHKSSWDYFLWTSDLLLRLWKIVAGTNLLKFPIFNLFLKLFAILVDRKSIVSAKNMLEEMTECLLNYCSVGIAPEKGRFRSENSGGYKFLMPFSDGAFKVSVRTGTPIVPISYMFAGESKPPMKEKIQKRWWNFKWLILFLRTHQWFSKVTVIWRVVLPAFYPEGEETGLSEDARVERLKRKVRNAMIKKEAYWWGVRYGLIDRTIYK